MKGMKKTSGEFQKNDVQRTSRVKAMEIVSGIMIILGVAAIIISFAECYFMSHHQFYSQYVFVNLDENFAIFVFGMIFFACGLGLV